ncbi:MAG: EamA family transporter RarD [Geminicoccaceae bacterium]|nr:EamA family transporter RarD [Geminicoccaceae bacterium]MCB9944217.1 EamA family transporter RarD [Geminicoccaceae bacterium]
MSDQQKGFVALAVSAVIWLTFPFVFKAVNQVGSYEVLAHRVVWSAVFMLGLLSIGSIRRDFLSILQSRRQLLVLTVTGALIAGNWLAYVVGVQSGRVLDVSLGFFISPLLSVLLAIFVLGEPVRPLQMVAIAIAALSTLNLVYQLGMVPIVSLSLAASFSVYGILRKSQAIPAAAGLLVETLMVVPLALAFLIWKDNAQGLGFFEFGPKTAAILVVGGVITAIPLLTFNMAARYLPYSVVGLTLYLVPSLLFIMGITLFDEPLSMVRLLTFVGIWTALAIYLGESLLKR